MCVPEIQSGITGGLSGGSGNNDHEFMPAICSRNVISSGKTDFDSGCRYILFPVQAFITSCIDSRENGRYL